MDRLFRIPLSDECVLLLKAQYLSLNDKMLNRERRAKRVTGSQQVGTIKVTVGLDQAAMCA